MGLNKRLPELLLWTAEETGAAIGVSSRTVKHWTASGRMPGYVSLLGRARWNRRVIEQWIEAGCPEQSCWGVQDDEDSETDDDSQTVIDNLG